MAYGSTYQIYGAGMCPNCRSIHPSTHQIKETQKSRFKLMQFMAEMSTKLQAGKAPLITGPAGHKFMIGILVSGATTIVAASGNNHNKDVFKKVAALKHYHICQPRKATQGTNLSISGRKIPVGQYMATQRSGASPPGDCAAPRLIQHAMSVPLLANNFKNWEMSEVYYQPNTSRRTRDDKYWVHGLSAHHCDTCENLVPLLMCPS